MNGDSEDFSSSYEPSKAAKWFHNRKRWDEDFHSVSNTFPDDHDKDEWVGGIFMYAAIIIGIGATLVLIVSGGYILAGCCMKPPPEKLQAASTEQDRLLTGSNTPQSTSSGSRKLYNRRLLITMVILCFIFLPLAAMTFKPLRSLNNQYRNALSDLATAKDNFSVSQTYVIKSNGSLRDPGLTVNKILAEDSSITGLNEFQLGLNETVTWSNRAIKALERAIGKIGTVSDRGDTAIKDKGRNFGYSVAGLMCFSVTLLLFTLIPKRSCVLGYQGCGIPINILFVTLLWVATAMLLAVGMMMGDYCMDPDNNAVKVVNFAHSPQSEASQTLKFYVTCDAGANVTEESGAIFLASQAHARMEQTVNQYPAVRQAVNDSSIAETLKLKFLGMENKFIESELDLHKAASMLGCSTLRATWVKFRNSTCENAPGDLLWLFATLTFLSLLLTSILSIGWTVCIGHPGRQRDTPPLVAKDASYHTVTETEFGHK